MKMASVTQWKLFQSTHPVRGGTRFIAGLVDNMYISIHPPREGWDSLDAFGRTSYDISIHPPREGWDNSSSRSARLSNISIHPPREGWDIHQIPMQYVITYFNPPTP